MRLDVVLLFQLGTVSHQLHSFADEFRQIRRLPIRRQWARVAEKFADRSIQPFRLACDDVHKLALIRFEAQVRMQQFE